MGLPSHGYSMIPAGGKERARPVPSLSIFERPSSRVTTDRVRKRELSRDRTQPSPQHSAGSALQDTRHREGDRSVHPPTREQDGGTLKQSHTAQPLPVSRKGSPGLSPLTATSSPPTPARASSRNPQLPFCPREATGASSSPGHLGAGRKTGISAYPLFLNRSKWRELVSPPNAPPPGNSHQHMHRFRSQREGGLRA